MLSVTLIVALEKTLTLIAETGQLTGACFCASEAIARLRNRVTSSAADSASLTTPSGPSPYPPSAPATPNPTCGRHSTVAMLPCHSTSTHHVPSALVGASKRIFASGTRRRSSACNCSSGAASAPIHSSRRDQPYETEHCRRDRGFRSRHFA